MKILSKPFVALATSWKQMSSFSQAKVKLTFFYVVILFLLLNIFVFSLYFLVEKNFAVLTSDFESDWTNHVTIYSEDPSVHILEWQENPTNFMSKQFFLDFIKEFVANLEETLFLLEGILIFVAGFLSYFLAGVTLAPIKEKMQQQKEFLADVSHEIKNPLSALQTTTEVALENSKWTTNQQKEYLTDFLSEIKRLVTLNSDLLFLENMNSDSEKFSIVNLSKILKITTERIRNFALKKKVDIHSNITSNCFIDGIEIELERLFFNLLHNAIKFTPSYKKVNIEVIKQEKNATVKIIDEGIGINLEVQNKIFDRFYKADSSRGFEDSGAGLGLSIVQKVIRHHNAKIFVENIKNKGACFTVVFNLAK